jgi:hypothetical protein
LKSKRPKPPFGIPLSTNLVVVVVAHPGWFKMTPTAAVLQEAVVLTITTMMMMMILNELKKEIIHVLPSNPPLSVVCVNANKKDSSVK